MEIEALLTPDDLAKSWKVTRIWIYKLVREKKIPSYRLGKCVRFKPAEIAQWLEEKRNGEYHIEHAKHRGRPRKAPGPVCLSPMNTSGNAKE